jgi:hypothetical protein
MLTIYDDIPKDLLEHVEDVILTDAMMLQNAY